MAVPQTRLFIAIEGGEGAGKTSLTATLTAHLAASGFDILATREPGATRLGSKLREVWSDDTITREDLDGYESLFLFAADRHAHVRQIIRPALAAGRLVITDRYVYSAKAYQAAEGVPTNIVDQICHYATGGLMPDRTYWLDIRPETGLSRIAGQQRAEAPSRYDLERLDFHECVRAEFARLHKQFPQSITRIDAERSAAEVLEEILRDINRLAKQSDYVA
jgi:dTMP kinase